MRHSWIETKCLVISKTNIRTMKIDELSQNEFFNVSNAPWLYCLSDDDVPDMKEGGLESIETTSHYTLCRRIHTIHFQITIELIFNSTTNRVFFFSSFPQFSQLAEVKQCGCSSIECLKARPYESHKIVAQNDPCPHGRFHREGEEIDLESC